MGSRKRRRANDDDMVDHVSVDDYKTGYGAQKPNAIIVCDAISLQDDVCQTTVNDTSDDEDDENAFEDVPAGTAMEVEDTGDMSDDSMPELGTVELTVGEAAGDMQCNKRSRRPAVTQRARAIRRSHHMIGLMCQVVTAQMINGLCNNTEILGRSLSLVPSFVVERITEHFVPGKREIRRDWASSDLHYFLSSYQSLGVKDVSTNSARQGLLEEEFVEFIETRRALRPWHQPMLLTAMLRALAFDARLCMGLEPPALKMTVEESIAIERQYDGETAPDFSAHIANSICQSPVSSRSSKGVSPRSKNKSSKCLGESIPRYWCEVFDQVAERWMPINAYTGSIERAWQLVRINAANPCAFAYIVGMDSEGYLRDITRRYTREFVNITAKQRLESVNENVDRYARFWWQRLIGNLERPADTERDAREEEEMEKRTQHSNMPKRIQDFASNPYYVLERNLCQNEVLYPVEPAVGMIRGEPVYLRVNVKTVRTKMAWMREGRVVCENARPAKQTKQRASTARARMAVEAAEASGHEVTADLFGEWQTELYRAPPVVDGRVPRNNYGRIDLFASTMLPDGAAHVPDSNAKRVCQELGIDAVDAVTSFEFRRGASTPVLQGVVIPHDYLELVKDALRDDRQGAKVRRRERMERRALRRWRKFLVALRVRADVDASFASRSDRPDGISFVQRGNNKPVHLPHVLGTSLSKNALTKDTSETDADVDENIQHDTGGGFLL
ncbi:hypothetical protein H4S08_004256 [Coemansia sp. RSA 1365]|nr:hypothetical protein H4S08_004256 [Coemansia sp. RSA 1365]